MGAKTTIQWSNASWTPLRAKVRLDAARIAKEKGYTSLVQIAEKMVGRVGPHCEHVSHGCDACYSETNNHRCLPSNGTGLPFDRRSRDLVDTFLDEKILIQPLHWKAPRMIFVCSQTDLFGEWVTDEQIDQVFAVMALCQRHTFQCLTKRPERMLEYLTGLHASRSGETTSAKGECALAFGRPGRFFPQIKNLPLNNESMMPWPLPNVWLGVSCEDQPTADKRIELLRRVPAAVRFVSYEPALAPVDFAKWSDVGLECNYCKQWRGTEQEAIPDGNEEDPGFLCPRCGEALAHLPLDEQLDQIIVGGESGRSARPMDISWVRDVIAQCKAAGWACFVKQLGARPIQDRDAWIKEISMPAYFDPALGDSVRVLKTMDRHGGEINEWPIDTRVREFPKERHSG